VDQERDPPQRQGEQVKARVGRLLAGHWAGHALSLFALAAMSDMPDLWMSVFGALITMWITFIPHSMFILGGVAISHMKRSKALRDSTEARLRAARIAEMERSLGMIP
jgi:hypothetical protein